MSNSTVPDLSLEKKLFAMMIALKNANEEMHRKLQFLEEHATGGPARYTQRVSAVAYGVDYDYSPQIDFQPSLINLDLWVSEAARHAYDLDSAYPNEDDDTYAIVLEKCVRDMIYKTQKSCLNIGSIQVMIIGNMLLDIINYDDYGLSSLVNNLLSLFTGCTKTYGSYCDYIQKREL